MASHASRVRADIDRWLLAGLIDGATADRLRLDVDAQDRKAVSFGSVLALLAGLMLAAAILLLVAASWEALPRLLRVGGLFALITAGYVGGAFLKIRGHEAFGEAAWLVGASSFGGAIALTGQMYHLSGDEAGAILLWCIGTGVAAALLASRPLTVFAVVLAAAWLLARSMWIFTSTPAPYSFLLLAAGLWAVTWISGSLSARHLLMLSLGLFVSLFVTRFDPSAVGGVMILIWGVLFLLAWRWPAESGRWSGLGDSLATHGLLGVLAGLAIVQFDTIESGAFVLVSALGLGAVIAALVMAGRRSRTLRALAYTGFGVETAIVYSFTIGTMLGTAGFFLSAAILLGLLAAFILRVERRIREEPPLLAGRP